MALAMRLRDHLAHNDARYDVVAHPYSRNRIETADSADIPGERPVKSVLLEGDDGRLLAVLPSKWSVHIGHLR